MEGSFKSQINYMYYEVPNSSLQVLPTSVFSIVENASIVTVCHEKYAFLDN